MLLHKLQIIHLRNLKHINLSDLAPVNVITGKNGSGKTSILEAIYILGTGKSFRSHLKSRLIQFDQNVMTLFCKISSHGKFITLGIEKSVNDETKLRVQGESVASVAQFAKYFPIQLFHPQSYELLDGGSKPRRAFIDWGLFHVEHEFAAYWNKLQRLLKQRNAAIKACLSSDEITLWDSDFVKLSEIITLMRASYIEQLIPIFNKIINSIFDEININFKFYRGWSEDKPLEEYLQQRLFKDKQLGYTSYGPHKADIRLSYLGTPIQDVLSRGQQKLLVFALRFSQAILLQQQTSKSVLFLIDDIASELDNEHKNKLLKLINEHSKVMQFILTGTNSDVFSEIENKKLFHVERGEIYNNNNS
jgi:DNA replication and repair protein RecF